MLIKDSLKNLHFVADKNLYVRENPTTVRGVFLRTRELAYSRLRGNCQ